MPEGGVAREIILDTLPEKSQALVARGEEVDALAPEHFVGEVATAMEEVHDLVRSLGENQQFMLTEGLLHSFDEDEDLHAATVQFLEYKSPFNMEGIGLEIRDDSVGEEGLRGPVRVMFVRWNS
jgi:hypothetical protein